MWHPRRRTEIKRAAIAAVAALSLAWSAWQILPHPQLSKEPVNKIGSLALDREPARGLLETGGKLDSPSGRLFASQLATIRNESDPERRNVLIESFITWALARDVREIFEKLEPDGPEDLIQKLVSRWAQSDARAAAAAACELPPQLRADAVSSVAIAWAGQNLSAATAWARDLSDSTERQIAVMAIASESVRADPKHALSIAADLPESGERDAILARAAGEWAASDPAQAADWAEHIPDDPLRQSAIATIATTWADAAPVAAANLALKSLSPGKMRDDALVAIVQRWVQTDAGAAASWVAQFPEGALREGAMENLVKLWARQDVAQPAEWLEQLPAAASTDRGILAYAGQISPRAPSTAIAWAETLGDTSLRESELEQLGGMWIRTDPAAAHAWLASATLPEAAKTRLREISALGN